MCGAQDYYDYVGSSGGSSAQRRASGREEGRDAGCGGADVCCWDMDEEGEGAEEACHALLPDCGDISAVSASLPPLLAAGWSRV